MAKTGQKILIVEDEPDIRKLVNYNLVQERFKGRPPEDRALGSLGIDREDIVAAGGQRTGELARSATHL